MSVFLKHIGKLILIALGLSMLLSFGSLHSLRNSSFYKPSFLEQSVEEKEFDYIILGASTGLTTLNTKLIDSLINTEGLNLSMDDTALSSQYVMLQHFLAQGKTTDFCVLAPNPSSFETNRQRLSDNDYRFVTYVDQPYVNDYYKQFSSTDAQLLYLSKWVPLLGVSYYNAELFYPSLLSLFKPEKRNRFDDKGNYTYPKVKKETKPISKKTELHIGFKNNYVKKIKDLCELNNIQLICYISPMESKKAITNTSDYKIVNHSDLLTNTDYFYDNIHVNNKGRKLSSVNFANTLKTLIKVKKSSFNE